MSQSTKCRNARKKAARKREWEEAQSRKNSASSSAASSMLTESEPTFTAVKIDRKVCCDREEQMRKEFMAANKPVQHSIRHAKIIDEYENKILRLQPMTGILPIFLNEQKRDHERIRIQQEIESTEVLKRKFGVRPASEIRVPGVTAGPVVRPNITTKPAPPRNQPVRQIISQTNRTQIGQTTLAQRSSLSPQVYSAGQKQTFQGVQGVAPSSETKMIQDQKIAALTRHGDLKITRKQMPANTVTQIPSTKIQNVHEDIKDFQTNLTESPPNKMTLCPITGKVLGQIDTLTDDAGLQQLLAAQENGQPLLVTGEDGTICQMAGKNEQSQTILIAKGAEGEQQCVYVAPDENDDGGTINLDSAVADAMQNMATDEVCVSSELNDQTQKLSIATDNDSQDGQMTAEVVKADLPSPGGTRRVVLLLPDGNFMMTEASDE